MKGSISKFIIMQMLISEIWTTIMSNTTRRCKQATKYKMNDSISKFIIIIMLYLKKWKTIILRSVDKQENVRYKNY